MKKIAALLIALCMVLTLCACGSGSETKEEPQAETQATEMPSVTAPPASEGGDSGMVAADDNTAPDADLSGGSDLTSEEAKLALSMQGKDVALLIEQIGEPNSTYYATSCIAPDGGAEDGQLRYDGFTVTTLRYPDGQEIIMGVF